MKGRTKGLENVCHNRVLLNAVPHNRRLEGLGEKNVIWYIGVIEVCYQGCEPIAVNLRNPDFIMAQKQTEVRRGDHRAPQEYRTGYIGVLLSSQKSNMDRSSAER